MYEVKYSICDAIYIGNTHQTLKKVMDAHFSNLLCLLNNGQKYDSFDAHFEQNFNSTTSSTDLRNYMTFKVVKKLKSDWCNENIYKTNLQLMYGGTFNYP